MEKVFWGIMGALTITFLALLGTYLYKSGAFSKEEEVVEVVKEPEEVREDIDAFLQPSHENYGDAMKALEDDREPIRQQDTDDRKNTTSDADTNVTYVDPPSEIASDRNDGYDNFLEEKESEDEDNEEEEKKEDNSKGKSVKNDEWQYTLYSDHVRVTKYLGSAINLTVPDKMDNQPVTEIWDSTFAKNTKLVNITFPDTVTTFGVGILKECTSLVDVSLPSSLQKTGKECFMGCTNLVRITIPSKLTKLADSSFEGCTYLSKVTIKSNLDSIGKNCFKSCVALKSFDFGKYLTSLGEASFSGCTALTSVTIPKTLDVIGPSCFDGCTAITTVTFQKKAVLSILGDMAFQNCSLIESMTLPSKLTSIGEKTFNGCAALNEIYIPKTVISIKADAFTGTAIKEVTINKSCVVNDKAFPSGIEKYYY